MTFLLRKILADLVDLNLRFHVADGKNAAHSLTRTLQVQFHEPVALILDADTYDSAAVEEAKATYEAYLRLTSQGLPFSVVLMVPSIEIIFFKAPEVIESTINKHLTERDLAASAYAPRLVLESCLKDNNININHFIANLNEQQLYLLRTVAPIAELRNFLQNVNLYETV